MFSPGEENPGGEQPGNEQHLQMDKHLPTTSQSPASSGEELRWSGPNDPENPMNWPTWRKVVTVGIVSAMGFCTPFAADVIAPSIPSLVRDLNSDSEALKGFVVSIYILGNGVGPIFFAPASEIWGRSIVFHISNVLFLAFTVGCALAHSMPVMLAFRFLAGCAGAAPLAVGSGTIADIASREQRGRYVAVFATGGQLAPLIGPVVGGVMSQKLSWRWTFWIVAIIAGVITVTAFVFLRETYATKILRARNRRLKGKGTSRSDLSFSQKRDIFIQAFIRPAKIFFFNPMVFFLACYQALVWGYRFLMYTTIPGIFGEHYHFNSTEIGLSYLGNGLGATAALYIISYLSDLLIIKARAKNGFDPVPEIRLLPMLWIGPLVPLGLLWYGWSAQTNTHWIVPILGTAVFAAGIVAASLPANLYLVDVYTQYAPSAMMGSLLLRSLAGGIIPLTGNPMFASIGVGWGCSLLSCVALLMCLLLVVFVHAIKRKKKWINSRRFEA